MEITLPAVEDVREVVTVTAAAFQAPVAVKNSSLFCTRGHGCLSRLKTVVSESLFDRLWQRKPAVQETAVTDGPMTKRGFKSCPHDRSAANVVAIELVLKGFAGAGFEPCLTRISKLLMVRDFWSKGLIQQRLRPIPLSSPVLRRQRESTRVLETSLTTSAVSRHTVSVQAAGAGSHKPRVGGGGRVAGGERFRMSTPQRSKSLTASLTVLPTKHLFGHDGP